MEIELNQLISIALSCGVKGIRTPESLLMTTHFPEVRKLLQLLVFQQFNFTLIFIAVY